MNSRRRPRAFSLVELLVVIAIIGILVALIMPAVQQSRETARRATCRDNLKQIGIALHNYHETYRLFPPGWVAPSAWTWDVLLLPYLDQSAIYDNLGVGKPAALPPPAGSPNDVSLAIFLCPSDGGSRVNRYYTDGTQGYKKSNYIGVHAGRDQIDQMISVEGWEYGIFGLASSISLGAIKDGTSYQFVVGERDISRRSSRGAIWLRATNIAGNFLTGVPLVGVCHSSVHLNSSTSNIIGFNSSHIGGANFLMADGAVRFINENLHPTPYTNLARKADGNVVLEF